MKCEHCKAEFVEGTGVDHELNATEIVSFCSMEHFKAWIDTHVEWRLTDADIGSSQDHL